MSVEEVAAGGRGLTGLCFDGSGRLFACGRDDGKIYVAGEGLLIEHLNTGGAPSGLAFDSEGTLHIADGAHRAILVAQPDGSCRPHLVCGGDDVPFRGPHSCVFAADGGLFFSDPGAAGDTSILNPRGSLYLSDGSRAGAATAAGAAESVLRVAHGCLAAPGGIALHPGESALYVCEASANRLVRFTQRPQGVFHATVFYQFAGRLGPSAVVCDHTRGGLLYIARPELSEFAEAALISVLSPEGALLREIEVPGPDITSLALSPDARYLYLSEATHNRVHRLLL